MILLIPVVIWGLLVRHVTIQCFLLLAAAISVFIKTQTRTWLNKRNLDSLVTLDGFQLVGVPCELTPSKLK